MVDSDWPATPKEDESTPESWDSFFSMASKERIAVINRHLKPRLCAAHSTDGLANCAKCGKDGQDSSRLVFEDCKGSDSKKLTVEQEPASIPKRR